MGREKRIKTLEAQNVALMNQIIDLKNQLHALWMDMRGMVQTQVEKYMQQNLSHFTNLLEEVVIERKVFLDKGLLTRDDVAAKRAELRGNGNG